MTMRSLALAGVLVLTTAGGAFAQSQQGGYLGLNPGANVQVSHGLGITQGSGQGGYLGENPGANATSSAATEPTYGSGEGGYLGMTPGNDKTGQEIVTPNDPAYAANGAPRAGDGYDNNGALYQPLDHGRHHGG
jgi:hypothetical protein